jgi:hypothetical protein
MRNASLQQPLCQLCTCVHHMLAVIQNDEELPVAHEARQRVEHGAARLFLDAQYGRGGLRHQLRVGNRRQFDEPDAVRIVLQHDRSHLHRQPRLAEAAHAEQRQQPTVGEQLTHLRHLAIAADE